MVAWRGTAACHAERRPKWPQSLPVLGAALVPFGWLSVLPRSDLALREHGLMNASDARSDVPPTRPLHQQAQPSPSRSVCCPACPLSRELPPGRNPGATVLACLRSPGLGMMKPVPMPPATVREARERNYRQTTYIGQPASALLRSGHPGGLRAQGGPSQELDQNSVPVTRVRRASLGVR